MTGASDNEDREDDRVPDAPLDFDPYRFGRPEHPIPPEYAPPGYVPPPEATPPPPQWPPTSQSPPTSQWPPAGPQPGYGTYPPPPAGYPGQPPPPTHDPYRGGQYQGAPLPPPGYGYGAVRTGNTKATVALVLGILSIVFCWLSILDLVLIVPAIVLGALARGDAKRFPQRGGRGPATIGLVCGLVGIVFAASLTIFYYTRVKPCVDNFDMNSPAYNHCVREKL